ncbi:MAG: phytanoyl-CoA dioxygenase family protein [Lewinellaceae bacterium]|nr:phytanoyl-CoA dioxygenase family protein [Saprospiraceae bacterium]MCB9338362.1 phytanoyl-CoA dioxygenase family protein [Lewinellaceae bacterium]
MVKEAFYKGTCPLGEPLEIPITVDEATDRYLALKTKEDIRNYYDDNGYVVARNLVSAELCNEMLHQFRHEVKPYNGYIYRQASANPEKHKFTKTNYMLNSILNLQSVNSQHFPNFRKTGIDILTNKNIQQTLTALMGEPGKLVQSMYFEGNPVTWAHQDCYYLDSERDGAMIGIWLALEDIHPAGGRFYIYPTSHKIDIRKNGGDFDIAFHHDRYKELVKKIIRDFQLECTAPVLRKGDVLFWGGKTIHGSLATFDQQYSRNSITGHYIPESTRFMQFQTIVKPLQLKKINGVNVNFPKDLDSAKNRTIMKVETTFPKSFQFAKKVAIKLFTK